MCSSTEEYEYEDKLELLTGQMKELILEIMLEAVQEIRHKHNEVAELNRPHGPDEPEF